MQVSFQNGDNFIRNMVTIPVNGARCYAPSTSLAVVSTGNLSVPIDEFLLDLRVDDPDTDEETMERFARGAAAFIARRTGYVLLPTVYEIVTSQWAVGPLQVALGPLRDFDSIEYQSARDVWDPVDPLQFWARGRDRNITLTFLEGFDSPALWQREDCIRMRFSAGYDGADESGGDLPIPDGLRTVWLMVTGHYYQNREMLGLADPKYGLQAVELGATSLLGQYRQFW